MSKNEKSPFVRAIIIVAVIVAVIAITFHAIGEFSYRARINERLLSDSEIAEIFSDLIPKAKEVNEIIWGEGLAVSPDADGPLATQTGAQYRPVSQDCKYKSVDEIKAAVAMVYSDDFIEKTINPVAFDGNIDEEETKVASSTIYPRYKETKDENGNTRLNIDITHKNFDCKTELMPETAVFYENELKKVGLVWKIDKIKCTLKCIYDGKEKDVIITIVKGENGYRLDDPTY